MRARLVRKGQKRRRLGPSAHAEVATDTQRVQKSRFRRVLFVMLMLLGIVVAYEAIFYTVGRMLETRYGMWHVPTVPMKRKEALTYDEYLKRRDPKLGWPFPHEYGSTLDVNGAQRNPFFPDGPQQDSFISLYGDSFTQGGDTSSLAANWGNVLSDKIDRYVANFGVGGYGTDQAYLRFLENRDDPSPLVIFGVHPGDALRNLTRMHDLENYQQWYALKPRFVLEENGKLKLVPIPTLTEEEYRRVLTEQGEQLILPNETLHPGGPAGSVKLTFPYTISVVKNLLRFPGFRAACSAIRCIWSFFSRNIPCTGLRSWWASHRNLSVWPRNVARPPWS